MGCANDLSRYYSYDECYNKAAKNEAGYSCSGNKDCKTKGFYCHPSASICLQTGTGKIANYSAGQKGNEGCPKGSYQPKCVRATPVAPRLPWGQDWATPRDSGFASGHVPCHALASRTRARFAAAAGAPASTASLVGSPADTVSPAPCRD